MKYVEVHGVLVDTNILNTYFSCDYEKCKGACCWANIENACIDGGSLLTFEAHYISSKRDVISAYVPDTFKSIVLNKPVYNRGPLYFTSMDKNGRCVYSDSEKKTCIFKTMCKDGHDIDIPMKCELYPLWVSRKEGKRCLSLIRTFEDSFCVPAFEKGTRDNILVYEHCKRAICRLFGTSFYEALCLI